MNTFWWIALCWITLGVIGTLTAITKRKLWKGYFSEPFTGIIVFVICTILGPFTLTTIVRKNPDIDI